MKNPYGYSSVSVYGADVEHLGRDAGSRLDVLAVEWEQATPERREAARDAARRLKAQCRRDRLKARMMNVRLSDRTRTLLLNIGDGNLSSGVRTLLGISRDVVDDGKAVRKHSWHSLAMRTHIGLRLGALLPGKSMTELLEIGLQVWDTLPMDMLIFLRNTAVREDEWTEHEEGTRGTMTAKLSNDQVAKLAVIGFNKSAGARIVLRTLADILEQRLTPELIAGYVPNEWIGRRFPKAKGTGVLG